VPADDPIPAAVRKRLPKAALIRFAWTPPVLPGRRFFQRNRLANAVMFRLGNLTATVRAPWLPYVARANHPHLFS